MSKISIASEAKPTLNAVTFDGLQRELTGRVHWCVIAGLKRFLPLLLPPSAAFIRNFHSHATAFVMLRGTAGWYESRTTTREGEQENKEGRERWALKLMMVHPVLSFPRKARLISIAVKSLRNGPTSLGVVRKSPLSHPPILLGEEVLESFLGYT